MTKRPLTLHTYIINNNPSNEQITQFKEQALADFRTKVVWNKRTQYFSKMLPNQAFIYNTTTERFEVDLELAKELAYLCSVDIGNGQRMYLGGLL